MSDSNVKSESNRANAQLSTGPKTPEGKAVSSLNGTTHGLAANRISPKNPQALAILKRRIEAYNKHYNPTGSSTAGDDPILADLIEDLAHARVRKDLIEDRLAELPDDTAHEYQLMHRYLREAARAYSRALREIEQIQSRGVTARHREARLRMESRRLQAKIYMDEAELLPGEGRKTLASLRQELAEIGKNPSGDPKPTA